MTTLELIERIRSKAEARAAQEELYQQTQEVLLERIRRRISPRLKPRLDAEDVLHSAFLRAMENLDGFHAMEDRSFFAWTYTIAKNLMYDTGKRRSLDALPIARRPDEKGPRESRLPGGQQGVSTDFARREYVASMLDQLKEKEAAVIRLRFLEGMSFEAIAERWSKRPGAIRRYYARSLDRLRELARHNSE